MQEFWRENGLHFECQRCGKCCKATDGFVFLSTDDLERLAKHFNITNQVFKRDWCARFHQFIVLKSKPNGECVFYSEINGEPLCRVYNARPMQCQTYPFWRQNLTCRDSWEREKLLCPGIGRGDVIPPDRIDKLLKSSSDWLNRS